jgi:phospholipid/cholesterol/gamma-HCH transport system substrate-binding protein
MGLSLGRGAGPRLVRLVGALGVVGSAVMSVAGCGLSNGLYNVTLPGGADLGSHPYSVVAEFSDAEDLVPQGGVRVNDVAVGRVSKIVLNRAGTTAEVTVELNGSVRLPSNAVASIQQTSLLGEKYVSLSAPLDATPVGRLTNGATIPLSRTSDGVQVEQVLGALSMLLNGGGIDQLHTIESELNQFAGDNEAQIRTFFTSVDRVVTTLNAHRGSIVHALEALATLSATLDKQNGHIKTVLTSLQPGIQVVASQHRQLIRALNALNHLSTVTVHTITESKDNFVNDLKALGPILSQLASADSALPRSLQELLTFPFSDGAIQGIKGDYLNAFATVDLHTPGGKVYPALPITAHNITTNGRPASAPSGLLPPTSSAASGLPSTLTVTPYPPSAKATAPSAKRTGRH